MTKNQKISHEVNGIAVEQRVADGFINGSAMVVAHNKDLNDWLTTKDVLELFIALADDLGMEVNSGDIRNLDVTRLSGAKYTKIFPGLIFAKRGSPETGGGTWLHPDLALQLAQWCSKPFAIQVSRWIRQWMTTGQNPVHSQADIERLIYRTELKDQARLRATGQVKLYLVESDLYNNNEVTRKLFIDFHDAINLAITNEPAWKMRNRLSKLLGRKITQNDLIRDYYPAIALQRYIAISEAAANLLRTGKCKHPLTAVEEAAELILPVDYIPSPLDFEEDINLIRQRLAKRD